MGVPMGLHHPHLLPRVPDIKGLETKLGLRMPPYLECFLNTLQPNLVSEGTESLIWE